MGERKRVKLSDLGRVVTGKTPSTKNEAFWNGSIPFVTPGDLQSTKHIFGTARYVTDDGANAVGSAVLPAGSICVSCIGVIGYVGITTTTSLSNQQINSIVVNQANDRDFVYYLLKSKWDEFKQMEGFSSVVSILNKTTFSDIEAFVPDLPTQRRIAAVLGALDDKIELNRKICENLEAQAQALFKGMKRRAEESSFVQVIDILSGGTPKTSVPEYWNGDIPFFSPKDVGGLFTISTERNITDQGLANCNSILYPKGTTFVTARGTVGKVCLAGVPMAMNQSCFALASKEIDPLLVYFYTCASVDSLKSKANGSVFAAITIAEFETEKIHRLTDSEEERFVKTIRPMFDQILVRQQESRALAAMRDALLPKLMSGELAVEKVEVAERVTLKG